MTRVPGATEQLGVRPAHLHIVAPELAARVAAPAFDTLPGDDGGTAAADPLSYLHVLHTPNGTDQLSDNRRALERLLRDGVFVGGSGPRFAWYRLATADHVQTGLVAEVAVGDYDAGRIVRHEHTRADREEHLAAYQRVVAADAGPVALAFRADHRMRALARRATAGPTHLRFISDDGVEHTVWTTSATDDVADIAAAASRLGRLYVTDGHHRFAAASRVAAAGRAGGSGPEAVDQWLLAALFPDDELRILPFHRAVTRPRGVDTAQLLDGLAAHVGVTRLTHPHVPDRPRTFTAFVDGSWYGLEVPAAAVGAELVDALDVSVLAAHVLAPALGVREPRIDPRLTYVAGDAAAVAHHCTRHGALGFMVRPTTMQELMAVADADAVMPPKSTLFSPKTRAGIVVRLVA